jgi:hypothetical protein
LYILGNNNHFLVDFTYFGENLLMGRKVKPGDSSAGEPFYLNYKKLCLKLKKKRLSFVVLLQIRCFKNIFSIAIPSDHEVIFGIISKSNIA